MRRWQAGVLALAAVPLMAIMSWPDLLDRPKPQPDARIAYGADPLQHVDLWRPAGGGVHPVVLMVHGGCWQTDVAQADIMNWIAADLRKHGIAVWNIEYRGVDRPGGGYPGTFGDVAAAADLLATRATALHLDISKLVAVGHSAGGHLVLWLAARPRVATGSPLHAEHPLPIATAISLGGLTDLEAATLPPGDTCGADAVHRLTGVPTATRSDVYADTSPAAMQPLATRQLLVNATLDRIAPPSFAAAYARKAEAAGTKVERVSVADEGHVELITPETKSWAAARRLIEQALR